MSVCVALYMCCTVVGDRTSTYFPVSPEDAVGGISLTCEYDKARKTPVACFFFQPVEPLTPYPVN